MERTVIEWLRRIRVEWGLTPDRMAAILRVDAAFLAAQLESPARPDSDHGPTVPPGLESAPPLIAIYRRLSAKYPSPEDQVKWLFTAHKDFGESKPIDVASSSLENLYWVGYYLETSTG